MPSLALAELAAPAARKEREPPQVAKAASGVLATDVAHRVLRHVKLAVHQEPAGTCT